MTPVLLAAAGIAAVAWAWRALSSLDDITITFDDKED